MQNRQLMQQSQNQSMLLNTSYLNTSAFAPQSFMNTSGLIYPQQPLMMQPAVLPGANEANGYKEAIAALKAQLEAQEQQIKQMQDHSRVQQELDHSKTEH